MPQPRSLTGSWLTPMVCEKIESHGTIEPCERLHKEVRPQVLRAVDEGVSKAEITHCSHVSLATISATGYKCYWYSRGGKQDICYPDPLLGVHRRKRWPCWERIPRRVRTSIANGMIDVIPARYSEGLSQETNITPGEQHEQSLTWRNLFEGRSSTSIRCEMAPEGA
jgi:hypothetical protein